MKKKSNTGSKVYRVFSVIVITLLAIGFAFPLYWIITGSFKTSMAINAPPPQWWPQEWVSANYQKLFSRQTAPLWEIGIPFTGKSFAGPVVPAAIRWLLNTIFMAVVSMLLTCFTAAMAGYALAKKRFIGRSVVFTLIVCAMALPKQVVLVPLVRIVNFMGIHDTLWAVILPLIGWPFGVFLMKQFSENIPTELLESAKIDGCGEIRTFWSVAFPIVKPGFAALAIFTFINTWNDYFMQLVMLTSRQNLTISLGVATMQAEMATNYGLIMAGAALAAVPIVTVFLVFQKSFTQGITMGAVKG